MRFIDEQVRVEAPVTGVDRGESPQSPSQHRPMGKHPEAVLCDIPTDARGQISESTQHLSLAYKNHESQNRHTHGHRPERHAKATLLFESQHSEEDNLKNESEHSSSRAGKENRGGHQHGAKSDQGSLFRSKDMAHAEHQRYRH